MTKKIPKTIAVILSSLALLGLTVFLAYKIYQTRQENLAPTEPEAVSEDCTLEFSITPQKTPVTCEVVGYEIEDDNRVGFYYLRRLIDPDYIWQKDDRLVITREPFEKYPDYKIKYFIPVDDLSFIDSDGTRDKKFLVTDYGEASGTIIFNMGYPSNAFQVGVRGGTDQVVVRAEVLNNSDEKILDCEELILNREQPTTPTPTTTPTATPTPTATTTPIPTATPTPEATVTPAPTTTATTPTEPTPTQQPETTTQASPTSPPPTALPEAGSILPTLGVILGGLILGAIGFFFVF